MYFEKRKPKREQCSSKEWLSKKRIRSKKKRKHSTNLTFTFSFPMKRKEERIKGARFDVTVDTEGRRKTNQLMVRDRFLTHGDEERSKSREEGRGRKS